jgi:protein ImuB
MPRPATRSGFTHRLIIACLSLDHHLIMADSSRAELPAPLWAAVCLPHLAIEVLLRGVLEPGATVVTDGNPRAPHIAACNDAASERGVRPGMGLAAAYAVAGELQVFKRDETLEHESLEGLAGWADQFTSSVCLSDTQPRGLLLEIGGSVRLFGGDPRQLGVQLRQGLVSLGFTPRIAAAPTPTAAWWLASAGVETLILDLPRLRQRLSRLSVTCMDVEQTVLDALHGIGVRSVGDCERLPRAETARRFGPVLHHKLDRAMGRTSDPREPYQRPEKLIRTITLPVPVGGVEALLFALGRLLREVVGVLVATGGAMQVIELELRDSGGHDIRLNVALIAPSRDVRHVVGLLRHRLEAMRLREPVERLQLEVVQSVSLAPRNLDLFDDGAINGRGAGDNEWLTILERLHARLGPKRVQALQINDDHRPEYAWRAVGPLQGGQGTDSAQARHRPLWLLSEPEGLNVRNGGPIYRGVLQLESVAERIEGGWWEGHDVRRDYHIAVNPAGERFWIYYDRDTANAWYLHGIFG